MAKKRVLVFGGNRFVGLHLLKVLGKLADEYQVFAITRSGVTPSANIHNLQLDRLEESALAQNVPALDFDMVFDLSAYGIGDLKPSLNLLADRVRTWIFMSSAGVYAKSEVLPLKAGDPKVSKQPHLGKLECERLLSDYGNLHFLILRPLYIYGPNNSFERETLIFRALEGGGPVYIPNDGSALLQFIHVDDLVRLMIELASLPANTTFGQIYHPAMSELYTLKGLIELIARVTGSKPNLQYVSEQDCQAMGKSFRELFPWRSEHYFADISNLNTLNLKTEIPLEDGMRESYRHYLAQRDLQGFR